MSPSPSELQILKLRRWKHSSALLGIFLLIGSLVGFTSGVTNVKAENLLVLTFHGVTDSPVRPWEIPYPELLAILNGLKQYQFSPLSPWDLEDWLSGKLRGGRRFLVTFDDGLLTSRDAILRLSREEGIEAALFVVLDLLGKPGYLESGQLASLASEAHCRVELHGMRHVSPPEILKQGGNLTAELVQGRQMLQELLGRSVTWYAYPFGDHDDRCAQAAASAGLKLGFTIEARSLKREDPLLMMPRLMYLKGAEQAKEPVPKDWMPPWSVQMGTLSITLSVLVFFLCIRMFQRAMVYGFHERKMRRETTVAGEPGKG